MPSFERIMARPPLPMPDLNMVESIYQLSACCKGMAATEASDHRSLFIDHLCGLRASMVKNQTYL